MTRNRPLDDEYFRIILVFLGMLAGLAVLAVFLWRIQVHGGADYRRQQTVQSIRTVRVPGPRGRLYDRTGVVLADNRPSFNVSLYLEELSQTGSWSTRITRVEGLIDELAAVVQRPPELAREDIRNHVRRRLPLPLLAWRDVGDRALARLTERVGQRAGIDIAIDPIRYYPRGPLACHVLGYVGRSSGGATNETYDFDLPELAGRSGLERMLDAQLRGQAGERTLRVDVVGYRREDLAQREPVPGRDVLLSISAEAQQLAEDALGDANGACVIVDPRNGDVLAMVSRPGFDPNVFIPFINTSNWNAISTNPEKPLVNRAIGEIYAPGSTFKPVTLMAALASGRINENTAFNCPGYFDLGRSTMRCWYHAGHGTIGPQQAVQFSCNVYCFHAGLASGHQPIHDLALKIGLGTRLGIELDGEARGNVPDEAWKRRAFRDGWRDGDTCNMAIGQGAVAATPLQMAMLTAAIANGGDIYRPRLVLGSRGPGEREFERKPPELIRRVGWNLNHLNLVRRGMRDVVMTENGTGRMARAPGLQMAGKTGTAQFESEGVMKRHAWMLAYAPFAEPRYALAMVVDEGVSGGETIAPRVKRIMSGLFPVETPEGGSG